MMRLGGVDAQRAADVLRREDAAWAIEVVLDQVIATLRRDASIPKRSSEQWALAFADVRVHAEDELTELINGCVNYHQVVTAIVEHFVEQEIDGAAISIPNNNNGGEERPT